MGRVEEPSSEKQAFRLLPAEEFEKLTRDDKIAYINRAIRVLTTQPVTVAVIKPPDEEK